MLTRKYKTNKLTSYYVRKDTPVRMIENVMIHHYVQREQVNMLRFFNLTGTSCFHYDKETTYVQRDLLLVGFINPSLVGYPSPENINVKIQEL